MDRRIIGIIVTSVVAVNSQAASTSLVWGETNKALPQYTQANDNSKSGLVKSFANQTNQAYQLQLQTADKQSSHRRYQLMYQGLPVWGYQLIYHHAAGKKETVSGTNVSGIEKDVKSLTAALSPEAASKLITSGIKSPIKYEDIEKIIFIDAQQKAHLAYHLSYYINSGPSRLQAPNWILDANTGEVLKQWNEARYEKIGQGLGGNSFPLPYRAGMYQHGEALPGLPSLGKFDVTVKDGQCMVETPAIKVVNLANQALGYEAFPVSVMDEAIHKLKAFTYPCSEASQFLNYSDGVSAPVNYAFSPVNDTMYFASETMAMYEKVYGVKRPLGDDLPLRAYTHLGMMDNAFAIPTIRYKGRLMAHQQIVIGNGDTFLTAPAQAVIGHELSHNFTALHSNLVYEGQSGAINEAFSDMAAIALQDYIRESYPWYWNGEDWTIGREAVIGGQPLRYMDEPIKDGHSIGHSKDYNTNLDVHQTSGVFNKAFYLLAHKPGFSIQKAFQLMVDANMNYWSPIAYYDFAACGVIQAAIDRKIDKKPVIESFEEVGVHCPMFPG